MAYKLLATQENVICFWFTRWLVYCPFAVNTEATLANKRTAEMTFLRGRKCAPPHLKLGQCKNGYNRGYFLCMQEVMVLLERSRPNVLNVITCIPSCIQTTTDKRLNLTPQTTAAGPRAAYGRLPWWSFSGCLAALGRCRFAGHRTLCLEEAWLQYKTLQYCPVSR